MRLHWFILTVILVSGSWLSTHWRRATVLAELSVAGILPETGHAYQWNLSDILHVGRSDQETSTRSELELYEDGRPLPTAHAAHDEIRTVGAGRFSHWGNYLIFTASDNSDPRVNQRRYAVRRQVPIIELVLGRFLPIQADQVAAGLMVLAVGSAVWLMVLLLPIAWLATSHRRCWFVTQSLPWSVGVAVAAPVAWGLHWNGLDVTNGWVRLSHFALATILAMLLVVIGFVQWLGQRRHAEVRLAPTPVRVGRSVLQCLLSVVLVLLIIESLARSAPVHDSLAINPGIHFFWPDWFGPRNELDYSDRSVGPKQGSRVLVLGDSYAEGAGVPRSERFCDRLQRQLQIDDPQAEVYCAGRCGRDTFDEADVLEATGDAVAPDVVIVAYVLNDAEGESPPHVRSPSAWQRLMLRDLRSYAYYRWQQTWSLIQAGRPSAQGLLMAQHDGASPGWRRVCQGMDRIADWCDQRGVRRLLVVFPIFTDSRREMEEVMVKVEQAAGQRGYETRNLIDVYEAPLTLLAVSRFDGHPGSKAHAITAKVLQQMLQSQPTAQWSEQRSRIAK